MNIMLGNQSPEQIERRLQITLSDEHKKMLMDSWQHKAEDIEVGKWHCFDIPFMFVCGDIATATKWRDVFMSYDLSKAELFQISWSK